MYCHCTWVCTTMIGFLTIESRVTSSSRSPTSSCDVYTLCTHVCQFGREFKSLLWWLNVFFMKKRIFWHLTVPASDKRACIGCVNRRCMFMLKFFVKKVDLKCDGHKFKHGKLGLSTCENSTQAFSSKPTEQTRGVTLAHRLQRCPSINPLSPHDALTLSSLSLPLSSSSTTSRELLSQFPTCSGWKWLKVGDKCKNILLFLKQFHENCCSKTTRLQEIKPFFRYAKWCFNASWGSKGLKHHFASQKNDLISLLLF